MINPKIKSIGSKEYNGGIVNWFEIEISDELHKSIFSLLIKLGFESREIEDFDTVYKNTDIFIFACKKI